MGKKFSSLFLTQCPYCKGTGYEPSNQSTYCKGCEGYTHMSIFRLPECLSPRNQYVYKPRYNIHNFEIR